MTIPRLFCDGACAPTNPGPMGIGVAVVDDAGALVHSISRALGNGTNNIAEHAAIEAAVDLVRDRGWIGASIFSDSQLAVKQLRGEYAVAADHLAPTVRRVSAKIAAVRASIAWVPREQNVLADALSKRALTGNVFPLDAAGVVAQAERALEHLSGEPDLVRVTRFTIEHLAQAPEAVADVLFDLKMGRSRHSTASEEIARFDARLKHGADAVSGMEAVVATRSPATRLKALRWAARGLAPALVCAKLSVEKAATVAYRQRNQGGPVA